MWFGDIYGHTKIIDRLTTGLKRDAINHAILLDGARGIGKLTIAKSLSRGLLCVGYGDCISCPSCIQFDSGTNPDFRLIEPENNVVRKEQIDSVIDFLSIKPFEAKYKIVVVDGFDKTTIDAQNAILKILEEPPEYGKIILITEQEEMLLDTIRSRVELFKLYPLSNELVTKYLKDKYNTSDEEAMFLAEYSGGSIGEANRLRSNNDFIDDRNKSLQVLDNAIKAQRKQVLNHLDLFTEENIEEILDLYITWIRDLKYYKITNHNKNLYNKDKEKILASQSFLSIETINKILSLIIDVKNDVKYNISPEFIMEMFFIDIMEECAARID